MKELTGKGWEVVFVDVGKDQNGKELPPDILVLANGKPVGPITKFKLDLTTEPHTIEMTVPLLSQRGLGLLRTVTRDELEAWVKKQPTQG